MPSAQISSFCLIEGNETYSGNCSRNRTQRQNTSKNKIAAFDSPACVKQVGSIIMSSTFTKQVLDPAFFIDARCAAQFCRSLKRRIRIDIVGPGTISSKNRNHVFRLGKTSARRMTVENCWRWELTRWYLNAPSWAIGRNRQLPEHRVLLSLNVKCQRRQPYYRRPHTNSLRIKVGFAWWWTAIIAFGTTRWTSKVKRVKLFMQ